MVGVAVFIASRLRDGFFWPCSLRRFCVARSLGVMRPVSRGVILWCGARQRLPEIAKSDLVSRWGRVLPRKEYPVISMPGVQ